MSQLIFNARYRKCRSVSEKIVKKKRQSVRWEAPGYDVMVVDHHVTGYIYHRKNQETVKVTCNVYIDSQQQSIICCG